MNEEGTIGRSGDEGGEGKGGCEEDDKEPWE
jgi:hypothetical protein